VSEVDGIQFKLSTVQFENLPLRSEKIKAQNSKLQWFTFALFRLSKMMKIEAYQPIYIGYRW